MNRRLLSACLGAVLMVVLSMPARLAAKPPDLPMNETNTVTPRVDAEAEEPAEPPLSGGAIVSGSARESVAPDILNWVRQHSTATPMRAHPLLSDVQVEVSEANTGSLIFGIGVNSNSGLTGSIVCNERNFACEPSKVVQRLAEDELPPAASIYDALPAALPTPNLYELRPTARRTLAGSLLFGFNPLMALLPTDKALDAPDDHPQRVAGDDVFLDMPAFLSKECEKDLLHSSFFIPQAWGDRLNSTEWFKWLVARYAKQHDAPAPAQNEGYLNVAVVAALTSADTPAAEIDAPLVPAAEALPMPQEDKPHKKKHKKHQRKSEPLAMPKEDAAAGASADGITCPYLRQQMIDRHACQTADPQLGCDVLDNLERLKKADDLLELARDFARAGHAAEAFECYALVRDLCPGSPCANRADALALELYLAEVCDRPAGAEDAAEPRDESSDKPAGVEQQVSGLMKACRLLVNEGLHEQAAELARQAYALDPERVMADPLVYKMHLLATTPRQSFGSSKPDGSTESSEPASCPYCPRIGQPIRAIVPDKKKRASGPTTLLVPPMPPVDYEVVPVLDGVLTEKDRPAGVEEASEEETPSSLDELVESIMGGHGESLFGIGINGDGSLRVSGEWSGGGSVYHVLFNRGCLAIWKTPDAAKVKP